MSPVVQVVLLPLVTVVCLWRLATLCVRRAYGRPSNAVSGLMISVYLGCAVFAVATFYGIESVGEGRYRFHVWLIWLEYLAIMVLVRALAQAFGAGTRGHWAAMVITGSVAAMLAAHTPSVWTGNFHSAPASLLWLYLLCAGGYIPYTLARTAFHLVQVPRPRDTMRITTIALIPSTIALALGFWLNAIEFSIDLSGTPRPAGLEYLSRALLNTGLVLLVIGTTTPAVIARARDVRSTIRLLSESMTMAPLATDIGRRFPELNIVGRQWLPPLTPTQIRITHYRRYILIRDALTLLSPDLNRETTTAVAGDVHRLLREQPEPGVRRQRDPRPVLVESINDMETIVDLCSVYNRLRRRISGCVSSSEVSADPPRSLT